MNVLVTGGAGYIGHHVCNQFAKAGHRVRVVDRCFFGPMPSFVEDYIADIRELTVDHFRDIDVVSHLAGLSNDPTAEYNPRANWEMNAVGTERLADLAIKAGVRRFIFASSASVYDGSGGGDRVLDETSPLNLVCGAYSISKKYAEDALLARVSSTFAPVILRQGTVCGFSDRMRFDLVVNTFVKDALLQKKLMLHGGGEQWRPMVDVTDVAAAHLACAAADEDAVRGQTFNVSQENYQVRTLARLVAHEVFSHTGRSVVLQNTDATSAPRDYRISNEKIARVLGFTPVQSVRTSIQELLYAIPRDPAYLCDPRHFNIRWMMVNEEIHDRQRPFASVY